MTAVYCSGLFSGPNPSPGLGVARSLREAFSELDLVGVDYSTRSTGLHHPVFDEVWMQRPWRELDLDSYASAIGERLDADSLWISGLDLETRWLAHAVGPHPRLLSPSTAALTAVEKPAADLARRLGLFIPPTISTRQDDWELHAFGREHGWRLWLKGPHYQAARVNGWRSLQHVRTHLADTWSTDELHLQAHIPGAEESIIFAASEGTLLAARHMRKAILTEEGKTWGGSIGEVGDVVPDVGAALEIELARLAWTGGGEIEMLRSSDGALWLIECNPRFPAWMHGVTLSGANLPAALVAATTGRDPAACEVRGSQFVRVVVEIPLRASFPLPEPVTATDGAVGAGKHPSGMPDLARRMAGEKRLEHREDTALLDGALKASAASFEAATRTPHRHLGTPLPRWMAIAERARSAADGRCAVKIAYSVKTDPQFELLDAARRCGFLAEAISAEELRRACDVGFAEHELILNGPGKSWPAPIEPEPTQAFAVFADSNVEMSSLVNRANAGRLSAAYLGPRLRPPSVASRFGVPLDDYGTFTALVAALDDLPSAQQLGLHFHWSSSESGHEAWFEAVDAALVWGRSLQDLTGRAVQCLDLGGGWFPDDFDSVLLARLPELVDRCLAKLDQLDVLLLEPGKALSQPLSIIESTVLEVRAAGDLREIVIDASIAELPESAAYPHRILSRRAGDWRCWGRGPDRILGRLCMENDLIRGRLAIPDDLRAGDRILIADAGAYDRSMSYEFGRG